MGRVFILGACRTPIGKMGGALVPFSAVDLASLVIKESLRRSLVPSEMVDHVCLGNVLQAGSGQNVARQAALKAGLSYGTTAITLNVVCGSGLEAVNSAARLIRSKDADIVVAGGVESMSQAPFILRNARFGYRMGSPMVTTPLIDSMVNDGLWDATNDCHMGLTAENVAEKYSLTRYELDKFAANSQSKACKAIANGLFADEILPVVSIGRNGEVRIDTDEAPRPGTTAEKLAHLKPVFKQDGLVTAGNSSGINDGAAAVVLISEKRLHELGLDASFEWIDGALAGVKPSLMGLGPIKSTRKLLDKLDLKMGDIDVVEANEAFASQSIVVQRELNIPIGKLNPLGGAIALGHPIGASGCRILVTLIHEMKRNGLNKGLATLCVGGGMGCSTIIANSEL